MLVRWVHRPDARVGLVWTRSGGGWAQMIGTTYWVPKPNNSMWPPPFFGFWGHRDTVKYSQAPEKRPIGKILIAESSSRNVTLPS